MSDSNDKLDVIAVGAHPDDCEIGCGGTLAMLANQGLAVGIIDLTDGEPTPGCDDPAIRLQEAQAAAQVLGIQKRIVLDLPNRQLFDSFEARVELAKQFRIYQPKIVLGLNAKTPMASPDHWQAAQITDAAVFYSRLSKCGHHRQLHYHLFFESEWSGVGPKQFVHDVSKTIETKLSAVRCYETQFPPAKGYVFDRVRSIAAAVGASAGFEFGEVLTSTRAIGSTDLFGTLQLAME
jgi:LmbE family N-acetylglucosaminyl deacetylase